MTGLILDVETLSNFCGACAAAAKEHGGEDTDEFWQWFDNDHASCEKNHTGSAVSMEASAAVILFSCSVEKHHM